MTTYRRIRRIVMCICPTCLGTGKLNLRECPTCLGTGETERVIVELVPVEDEVSA